MPKVETQDMTLPVRQAVILCGGLGTRLSSLTRETPKPLLAVGGTPFLQLLIQEITRYGIDRFLLLAAYKADQFQSFAAGLSEALGRSVAVEVAIEPDQAGTGGALFHARHLLDDAFYLFNGDTLLDAPLDALAQQLARTGAVGCLALRHVDDASRYGVVEVDGARVVDFGRRSSPGEAAWINGGVAAFCRSLVDYLQPQGAFEEQALPLLARTGALSAVKTHGFFIDIGVPADFERGQEAIPEYRRRPAVFFDQAVLFSNGLAQDEPAANLEWMPGAIEAVALAAAKGFYVFMVMGRKDVDRLDRSPEVRNQLISRMNLAIARSGVRFDDRLCWGPMSNGSGLVHGDTIDGTWSDHSMVLSLMNDWPVHRARSVMMGNCDSDMRDADEAGVMQCLVSAGRRLDEAVIEVLEPEAIEPSIAI